MSSIDQIIQLTSLASAGDDLDLTEIVEGISQRLASKSAKDIAEARQLLGEDADKYLPISRSTIRNQRELQRIQHQARMDDLEYRRAEARVRMEEAGAAVIHGNATQPTS